MKKWGKVLWIGVVVLLTLLIIIKLLNNKKGTITEALIPDIKSLNLKLKEADLEKSDYNTIIVLGIPIPTTISLDSVYTQVFIAGKEIAQSTFAKEIKLNPENGNTSFELPLTFYHKKVLQIFDNLEDKNIDSVKYIFLLRVFGSLIPGKKFTDLKFEKKLPAFRIFEAKIEKVHIDKLGLKETALKLDLKLKNENKFRIAFKDVHFDLKAFGEEINTVNYNGTIELEPNSNTLVSIPIAIKPGTMAESIVKTLKNKGKLDYELRMTMKADSKKHEWLNESQFTLVGKDQIKI